MLSLTIFAVAASAATQTAPAIAAATPPTQVAERERAASAVRPQAERMPTVWRFIEPGVEGGQIWL